MESKDAVEPVLIIQTSPSAEPCNEPAQPARSLPSTTTHTPESGYPLRVNSNGSRVSGNRTSTSSDVKPSRKQTIEKRQKAWRRTYRPLAQLLLFLIGMVNLFLIWSIFDRLLILHITPARVWEFLPQPVDPHFDYYSISSSSETCNEFAREWAQADNTVMFVSIFLTVCLSYAEPHTTNLGGSAVSVYGDAANNSCFYMDGSAKAIPNLASFRGALRIEPNSEHIGAYSVAIPGELSNVWAMGELYKKLHYNAIDDWGGSKLRTAINHFSQEIQTRNLRFPISASLSRTIEAANMDSQMVFRKKFARNVFGDSLDPLEEGSLFAPYPTAVNTAVSNDLLPNVREEQSGGFLHDFWKDIISIVNAASFDGAGTGITASMVNDTYWKESLNAHEPTEEYRFGKRTNSARQGRKAMRPIDIGGGVSGCVSRTGGKGTLQPRTPEHLKSFRDKGPKNDSPRKPTEDIEIYMAIFQSMYELQNSTVNQPTDFYTTLEKKRAESFESFMKVIEKLHERRIEPHAPWSANMIAVVDHKRNQAFARTGTLGTGYGGLLQTSSHNVVLNNMMSQFGRFHSEIKGHQNDLQPMILFKNGKILTAYAGSGGYLTRSLDLARQFTSLIFSVFYDVPLAKALTTPLHFALPGKKQFLSRGLPYSYANNIRKEHKGEQVLDMESLIDMAAAVHDGRSVFFNGDDDVIEGQVMPNGF